MENNFAEFTGKTVEEAVEEGLAALNLKKEEAVIEILEEPKKKFLFGSTKAKVRISKKEVKEEPSPAAPVEEKKEEIKEEVKEEEEAEEVETVEEVPFDRNNLSVEGDRACTFLEGLFSKIKLDAEIINVVQNDKLTITVSTPDNSAIIGNKGELLDAIQTLTSAVANINRTEYMRVVVDCGNYREKREEMLRALALKVAAKATKFGKKMKLKPMNPYDRRIIHSTLADSADVTTKSEGKEPNRFVVIIPNNLKPYNPNKKYGDRKPYNKDRKPYNGERKPYNKDRKPYNGDKKYSEDRKYGDRKPYNKNSSSGSGTSNYGKSSYSSNSSYKKKTTVLGTFLGNSGNKEEK